MESKIGIPFDKILMDTVMDMVFVVKVEKNRQFRYAFINQSMIDQTGLKKDALYQPVEDFLEKDIAKKITKRFRMVIKEKRSLIFQDRYMLKRGDIKYSKTRITPFFDQGKNCTYIASVSLDITEEILNERKFEDSDYHFQLLAENIQDLITLIDRRGIIIYTSPSYNTVLGHDHEEYQGKHYLYKVYEQDWSHVDEIFNEALRNGDKFTVRFRQYNSADELKWSESHGTPVFDHQNQLKHIVVVTRDISIQMAYEKELQHYANHDSHTGVPNRRYFQQYLQQTLQELKEKKTKVTVIIFDIDNFKQINDQYGHDVGDDVILEFSKRIKQCIGMNGIVARFGGDEFVAVLPDIMESSSIYELVKKIRNRINSSWKINHHILKVTTSIGIAITSDKNDTPLTMIKKADMALYDAKNAGKNTYKIAR